MTLSTIEYKYYSRKDVKPYTPWGVPDAVKHYSDDVQEYTTPSHGGFHVTGKSLERIPEKYRTPFAGYGWFEEDCDWVIVVRYLPEFFSHEAHVAAESTFKSFANYFNKMGTRA